MRATFIPAVDEGAQYVAGDDDAGPSVQTILVRAVWREVGEVVEAVEAVEVADGAQATHSSTTWTSSTTSMSCALTATAFCSSRASNPSNDFWNDAKPSTSSLSVT